MKRFLVRYGCHIYVEAENEEEVEQWCHEADFDEWEIIEDIEQSVILWMILKNTQKQKEKKKESKEKKFFQKCSDKVNNGEDIYSLLGLGLCSRFKLKLEYDGKPPKVVWTLVNYYVNEVEEDK